MKNFLISLSNDKIVFPDGMIASIADDFSSGHCKLIVFSGKPGTGKTVGIDAVVENLKTAKHIDHNSINRFDSMLHVSDGSQDSLSKALLLADKLPTNSDGLSLIVWDEVKGLDTEFEAIDKLISKGYSVLVASQDAGIFNPEKYANFSSMAEFQGGLE